MASGRTHWTPSSQEWPRVRSVGGVAGYFVALGDPEGNQF
jgi:hypothetical protein